MYYQDNTIRTRHGLATTFPCYKRVHETYAIANFYASDAMSKLDHGFIV